ncbi:MAG: hypothetical protein MRZ46_00095 [Oscillospiraceae bacterium]|nr:hypothetical protein [Oscillospiraceae bacterium]
MDNKNQNSYLKKIEIEELLAKSDGLKENQKEFFRALAKSVVDRQKDFFSHIEKNVISQNNEESTVPQIFTFLNTDKENMENIFNPMLDNDEDDSNIIFIDCPYDKVNDYEKTEDGKKFKLEKTDIFVKKEKMIADLFKLYNIHQPYIYSPYSRRAFKLFELNEKTNEYEPVNLKRNNYDLSQISGAVQGTLMWNVSITSSSQLRLRSTKAVIADEEFDRYNRDENSFIIPENRFDIYHLIKITDKYFYVKSDSDIDFMKIEIHENKINRLSNMFSPKLKDEISLIPKNIFTEADIKLAVDAFYHYPNEYKGFSLSNAKEAIKAYTRDYNYSYNDLSEISRRNKNYCYLCFEDSGIDNFFIDRVNYFIAFMRYNYPNFFWVGVKV